MPNPFNSQLDNIGLALQGFGAGIQGQGAQFSQGLQANTDRQQQMAMQQQGLQVQQQNADRQFGLQQQEFGMKQDAMKQQQALALQKATAADVDAAKKLYDSGNKDGVVQLGVHHLQVLNQFAQQNPGIDLAAQMEDAQRLTKLAIGWKNGNEEAGDHLKNELNIAVTGFQSAGLIPKPKGESNIGKAEADYREGLITAEDLKAIKAKESSTEGSSPFLSELGKRADLKKQLAADPTNKDLQNDLANLNDHIATLAGGEKSGDKPPSGYQWKPDGTLEVIKGGPADKENNAPMGSREQVFLGRILSASNQAAKDLSNVVELPMTASSGVFGGRKQGGGLLDATKEVLANKMTDQDAQTYNALSTGFQRNLAAIESAGLAPNGSLSHQMDSLIFKEGDFNSTKLHKLAQIRQIVEAGLETALANPRMPESQRKHAEDVIASIQESVPFTQKDLLRLDIAQAKNPDATLKDVMESMKGGGEVTNKAQYDALPSGAIYTENGKKYRKP